MQRDVRFFLDENMPVVAVPPLRAVFGDRHEFETARTLGVTGVDDVDLYPRVRAAGVLAIISKDDRQLRVEIERRGLFENQLSFVHLRTTTIAGQKGLALTVASLAAGIPYIEERWMPEPYVFRLKGLQSAFSERIASHQPIWRDRWGDKPDG
nr:MULTISPECIES: hypothetical protein [Microbacterium]